MIINAWIYVLILAVSEVICDHGDGNDGTSRLQKMVETLVTGHNKIIGRLEQQGRTIEAQATRILTLETTVVELTVKLTESSQKAEAYMADIEELVAHLSDQNVGKDVNTKENEEVAEVEKSDEGIKSTKSTGGTTDNGKYPDAYLQRIDAARRKRQVFEGTEIAFSAGVSRRSESLGPGQIIMFDKLIVFVDNTNSPSTYSTSTGVFVAPVSGVYVFAATMLGALNVSGHFHFYKNNAPVSILHVHGGGSSHTWDSAAQTILLLLERGDNVTVRNGEAGVVIEGQYGSEPHSIFSGFLLYQHESNPGVIG